MPAMRNLNLIDNPATRFRCHDHRMFSLWNGPLGLPLFIVFALTLATLLVPPDALALSTDKDQPIHIEADLLQVDESAQLSRYVGNVDMKQGSLKIRADQVVLHFDSDNNLQKMDITGNPAQLEQQSDNGDMISGSALNMTYYEKDSVLEMRNNAEFRNGTDLVESDHITVNTETNALQAGNANKKQRVRMLIQPRNSETDSQ